MEKKFEWNKDVEDALRKANIPDDRIAELRPRDVEKIDPELLDGISGGSGGMYSLGGNEAPLDWSNPYFNNMTTSEGIQLVQTIYDNFGEDICIDMCNDMFCHSYDWSAWIHSGGPAYAVVSMWSVCYGLYQQSSGI